MRLLVGAAACATRQLMSRCSICDELVIHGLFYIENPSTWSNCDLAFQTASAELVVRGG